MSAPGRHPVRVWRSPKIGVFLALGVALGVVVAVLATLLTPPDGQYPTGEVLGFIVLLCAPVGAAVGGLGAVALEAVARRRARILEAERVAEGPADRPSAEQAASTAGVPTGDGGAAGQSGEGLPGGVHP